MADLTITAANVVPGANAVITNGVAGATITAGRAVYLDLSDNRYKLADANASAATAVLAGIALNGASSGQPVSVQTGGNLNIGATLTPGEIYVLSANPGGVAPKADLASGHSVSIVGVATSASNLSVNIFNSTGVV